jgi:hypothetical protein
MEQFAGYVHPKKGVRFSPYAFVDRHADVVLTAAQVRTALGDRQERLWGHFDGSGDEIRLTFDDYYKDFVYDRDFAAAERVGYNTTVRSGNTINNIPEMYPGAIVVEYHVPAADPIHADTRWASLRLVLERSGESWFVVGVVHDEWTM